MAFFRLIGFSLIIFFYFLNILPFYPFYKKSPHSIRPYLRKIVSFYAKLLNKLINIESTVDDPNKNLQKKLNFLVVSNHLSYLDILAICAHRPCLFVTSKEVQQSFLLGQICELAGCLFVDRRNRRNLDGEIKTLAKVLNEGMDIVLFPEATSTNGLEVLKFRRPLFKSVMGSAGLVLPITINYTEADFEGLSNKNRDNVFWYGEMEFFPHLWRVLKNRNLKVIIHIGKFLDSKNYDDYRDLADEAYLSVKGRYKKIGDEPI